MVFMLAYISFIASAQVTFNLPKEKSSSLTAATFVPSQNAVMFFAASQLAFYNFNQNANTIEWFTSKSIDNVTAAVNNGNDKVLVFDGSSYIEIKASTGDILSDWTLWQGLPSEWRNRVTSVFTWDSNNIIIVNKKEYVMYNFETQSYTTRGFINEWPGWPQDWGNGIDAAVNIGDGFIYFFNNNEVAPYNIEKQTFYTKQSLSTQNNRQGIKNTGQNVVSVDELIGCISGNNNEEFSLQKTTAYGNTSGNAIEDRFKKGLVFSEIKIYTTRIWGKAIVCGIQTILKDETGRIVTPSVFGKTSSTVKTIKLESEECIIGISGSVGGDTGNYINNIKVTTTNRTSNVIGNRFVRNAENFSISVPQDAIFDGFYGTFNNNISSIGIKYFGKKPTQQKSSSTISKRKRQYVANSKDVKSSQVMDMAMGNPAAMVHDKYTDNNDNNNKEISEEGYEVVDAYIDDYDDFTSELGNMAEFMVQPLSGIDWLGAGFDILYFDPLNPNNLRARKPFRTVLITNSPDRAGNKNQYLKPFGSEFYSSNSGSVVDSTSWVSSYQQFTNSFGVSMSPKIGIPKLGSASYSPSYKEMNRTSLGSQSIYMFNKIKRKIHQVELRLTWIDNKTGQKYKQKIDKGFIRDVSKLRVPSGAVKNIEITKKNQQLPSDLAVLKGAYFGLINKYGTHFAKKVGYGGQYISRTQIKRSDYEKTRMTEVGFKAAAEVQIKAVTVGNQVSFNMSDGEGSKKSNQAFRRDVFVQGGNGEDDLNKWRDKVDQNLAPIEIYFAPISDILIPEIFSNDSDITKKEKVLDIMIDKYITDKYREGLISKNDFFRELPDLPVPSNIMVKNGGGYVMWFEVTYEHKGKWVTKESGDFTLGRTESVEIPFDARNITIKASQTTGEIFTKTFKKPETVCYKCWGTIFKTYHGKCNK